MGTRYNATDYHAEMLPRVDSEKPKQQKIIDEKEQAEIDICLNCKRKTCTGGGLCLTQQKNKKRIHKQWTKEENDYIMENYGKMRNKDIAIALSRTPDTIRVQYNKLIKGETK